jgi:hypothetical protein
MPTVSLRIWGGQRHDSTLDCVIASGTAWKIFRLLGIRRASGAMCEVRLTCFRKSLPLMTLKTAADRFLLDVQSGSFAEATPNSLSNSSIVGRLPFSYSGRLSARRYSDLPIGLLRSRKRVLGNEAISCLAQDDTYTRLVVGMPQEVVYG